MPGAGSPRKNSDPLIVDSEKAVPLAIAANELIHNAIDHGFNGMDKGFLSSEHLWMKRNFMFILKIMGILIA